MKLTIEQFSALGEPVPVVVHSIEQALYQVTVLIDGVEHLLVENSGGTFRRHSLQQVREVLQTLPVQSINLRQISAYDEMIGQPPRERSNALEIPLSLDDYPPPVIH